MMANSKATKSLGRLTIGHLTGDTFKDALEGGQGVTSDMQVRPRVGGVNVQRPVAAAAVCVGDPGVFTFLAYFRA